MSKITYENKEALNQNPNIPDINKVNDTDMNMIKNVVNNNETKVLLAVSSSAPATCDTGDIYFNTTDNLIYTATATNTWSTTGIAPTENTIYIEFTSQTAYAYDGTTLVSVGGGAGGGETLPIGSEIDFDGSVSDIPDGWEQVDKLIKIKQFSSNITVPANSNATILMGTIATPTGYTLLGVLNKAGGFADQWQVDFTINSVGSVQAYVRSYYGTELTSEISCTVLFVKTDSLGIL